MKKYLFAILFIFAQQLNAQTPIFSQFFSNPVYINPANAGATKAWRFIYSYRNQWKPNIGNYNTNLISIDRFFAPKNNGHAFSSGILIYHDQAGEVNLQTTQLDGIISLELPFKNEKWRSRLGLQAGVGQKYIQNPDLIFEDEILSGSISSKDEEGMKENKIYYDVAFGGLIGNHNFWLGVAVHHLLCPRISINNFPHTISPNEDLSKLKKKLTIHGGLKIPLLKKQGGKNEDLISLKLETMYQRHGKSNLVSIGGNLNWGFREKSQPWAKKNRYDAKNHFSVGDYMLALGLWYRGFLNNLNGNTPFQTDALIGFIGIHKDNILLNYSYDFTLSSLGSETGGSHEITLILRIPHKNDKVICPPIHKYSNRKDFPMLQVHN